ncbi:putative pyridoxal kinase [Coemansia sp. RSA 552]|nr:putative pyridoxal kinase [Coemansia sp. RSA 552]
MARILSIQSHVVAGYVGNRAATFPLQLLGHEVDVINTVQLSNHTGYNNVRGERFSAAHLLDLFAGLQANGLDRGYTHLLAGYMGNAENVRAVATIADELRKTNPGLCFVLDPVMGDDGALYVPEELVSLYRNELCPLASLVTPNQFEAELLTGLRIASLADAARACDALHALGVPNVVITSARIAGDDANLHLVGSERQAGSTSQFVITFPRLTGYFTGSGDLFAALLLARHAELALQHKGRGSLARACELAIATQTGVMAATKEFQEASGVVVPHDLPRGSRPPELVRSLELRIVALPPHLIRNIIEYVIEAPNNVNLYLTDTDSENTLLPLLHVCHAWRATALPIMCSGCTVVTQGDDEGRLSLGYSDTGKTPCVVHDLDPYYNRHVRTVRMKLDYTHIASGTAARQLECLALDQVRMPSAYMLNVQLAFPKHCPVEGSGAEKNAQRFVAQFHRLFPAVRQTTVALAAGAHRADVGPMGVLMECFTGERQQITRLDLRSVHKAVLPAPAIRNLTMLSCRWDDRFAELARIIHANSQSLVELRICYFTAVGFERLVLSDNGRHITFPYLTHLSLTTGSAADSMAPQMAAIDGIVPFPRIQRLEIDFAYPFLDDLPLRGNSSSLNRLAIHLDQRTIRLLYNCGIFHHRRLHTLKHLDISRCSERSETTELCADTYNEFFARVLPNIQCLFIKSQPIAELFVAFAKGRTVPNAICALSLRHDNLSLGQVVNVLKALPLLQRLDCTISELDEETEDAEIQYVGNMLRSKHQVLGPHLQLWKLDASVVIPVNTSAACILLIADRCPFIKSVIVPPPPSPAEDIPDDSAENIYSKLAYSSFYSRFRATIRPALELGLNQIGDIHIINIHRTCSPEP